MRIVGWLLFIDFSSAFNTLQPHLLIQKLKQLAVSPSVIRWYHSFLTNTTQLLKVSNSVSQVKTISTGAPQGCVSSPVLFTRFTNECSASHVQNYNFKYSDDSAALSLLQVHDSTNIYHSGVERFVEWWDTNHLTINVKQTEEIIFNPKGVCDHSKIVIHNQPVAQIQSYKYLSFHIHRTLTWTTHVDCVCSRLLQRLYFLRRLQLYRVEQRIMFYFIRLCVRA